jgi:hypothetical protein
MCRTLPYSIQEALESVYQSQVDWSTAQESQAAAAGSFVAFTMINGTRYG